MRFVLVFLVLGEILGLRQERFEARAHALSSPQMPDEATPLVPAAGQAEGPPGGGLLRGISRQVRRRVHGMASFQSEATRRSDLQEVMSIRSERSASQRAQEYECAQVTGVGGAEDLEPEERARHELLAAGCALPRLHAPALVKWREPLHGLKARSEGTWKAAYVALRRRS